MWFGTFFFLHVDVYLHFRIAFLFQSLYKLKLFTDSEHPGQFP